MGRLHKYTSLTLIFLLISNWCCYAQDTTYNTTIVVNLKKTSDKFFVKSFNQFTPYGLGPFLDTPPPYKVISSTPVKTHLKVNLTTTSELILGFQYFYINPGDSLNFDYETLLDTPEEVIDTIIVNHGNVLFRGISYKKTPGKFRWSIFDTIRNLEDSSSINEYLSKENVTHLIAQYTEILFKYWPNLKGDKETREAIKQISLNEVYYEILFALNGYVSSSKKEYFQKSVVEMLKYASENDNLQYTTNWIRYLHIYKFFKSRDLNASEIISQFENCDEVIKQYILLNLLRDGLLDESQVFNKITFAPYKEFEEKIIQEVRRNVKLPEAIYNTEVFDVYDSKHTLGEIFENSTQPYLLLDFCGTWCKPCIEAIARYAENKHLDNSKKVKPIWIFFENDKSKWVNILLKYQLKKENCFIITGNPSRELIKEFTIHTGWKGEFPHYFLFGKDGKTINADAESISKFSESSLPKEPGPPAPTSLDK